VTLLSPEVCEQKRKDETNGVEREFWPMRLHKDVRTTGPD
jgi:hypothetical protein